MSSHDAGGAAGADAERLRRLLAAPDADLLAQCEFDTYRASGPGGQKRNKTSSAVRLRHAPSGLQVIAEESRSQHENKALALRRLRVAIAVHHRLPLSASPPPWPDGASPRAGRLQISPRNPAWPAVLAILLDAWAAAGGKVAEAAAALGLSGSNLTRTLLEEPSAWAEANRIRAAAGLPPLRA
jgi:hypothetical protein